MNKNIFSKRVKDLRLKNSMTVTRLAKEIGCDQPKMSKLENPESEICPTLEQLIALANFFNVSTDYLLGITQKESAPEDMSLSDIFSLLFKIDNMMDISIGECETDEYTESNDVFSGAKSITTTGIYFKNCNLSNFLKEWGDIKKVNITNHLTKERLLQAWKNAVINDNHDRIRKWDFRNLREQGKYIADQIIADEDYSSFYSIPVLSKHENLDVFKEYIESGNYILDFFETDQELLLQEFKKHCKGGINVLANIDEELPPFN